MAVPQSELRRLAIIRHIIYALVAVSVILPYLISLPLPFEPSPWAVKLYQQIDQLEPGSPVLLAFDYDPASEAELYPMSLALLRHCFKKDLIPIVMTHWQAGVGLNKKACETAAADAKTMWGKEKLSGRDFVFLGFRPGYQNLVLNMGENLKGAFEKDYYGKSTQSLPALENVQSLKDIKLLIDLAAGATVEMWIAYAGDRFDFPFGAGCTAVMAPDLYPFLQSGQIVGFLGGLRGAADYEVMLKESDDTALLQKPGDATRGMQVQSVTHVLLIVLILAANAGYVISRFRRGRED